jgi:hypothetical protein
MITDEVLALYRELKRIEARGGSAANSGRRRTVLHALLGLAPWHASVLDASTDEPPASVPRGSGQHREWALSRRLRLALDRRLREASRAMIQ